MVNIRPANALRAVALAVFAFILVPASATAAETALERIQREGVLRIAMFGEDVPPFFYRDAQDNLVGIDPSLARDIAGKLGVKPVFVRSAETFDEVVEQVRDGSADIAISLLSDTLDRAMRVTFSTSYASVRQFLLINRLQFGRLAAAHSEIGSVPTLLDQRDARIGVIAGTSYVGFLEQDFPNARMDVFESWADMLAAVKAGEIVALLYDEIEIGNWRLSDPAGSLELRPYHLEGHPDTIAIATAMGDGDLTRWLDLYLIKANDNGFLPALLRTHLYSADRTLADE
jgi:ABC-type amino acid transport substrate-binding protein